MTTRSHNNIFKHKKMFAATKHPLLEDVEPTNASIAIKNPKWKHAMEDELLALERNGTWEHVDQPLYRNVTGCKWVFKVKQNSDETTSRYKARLVAKSISGQVSIFMRCSVLLLNR